MCMYSQIILKAVTVGDGKTGLFNNVNLDRLQAAVG